MNATAFGKGMPFGARINAIFSSDIGHFDVPDMLQPVPEAYELVEDGLITPADFRDFTFSNAVRLWGTQNPRFFEGTRVAKQAAALLAEIPNPHPRRRRIARHSSPAAQRRRQTALRFCGTSQSSRPKTCLPALTRSGQTRSPRGSAPSMSFFK